jgi:hypothetical protein
VVRPWLVALLLAAIAGAAIAGPSPRLRMVLADPDPELRRAMELALAPYRFEVVIEGAAPSDASLAQERADADTARFVVWREGAQLVVYDRELGTTARRDSQSGVLDPPTAAAAALTIKTMMRLPPPPPPEQPAPPPSPAPDESGIEFRLQAGLATRIEHTDETTATERFGGAITVRPFGWLDLRIGVAVDGGAGTDVDRASFKGTFSDWSVLGVVGWTVARGHLEVEPHIGFGVRRATLDGAEQGTPRTETATLTTARGGAWARLRYTHFAVGVSLAVDDVFGTPTYTKTSTPAVVFQVPGGGVELGGVITVDL